MWVLCAPFFAQQKAIVSYRLHIIIEMTKMTIHLCPQIALLDIIIM